MTKALSNVDRVSKTFKQGEDINEEFSCRDIGTLELPFWLTCLSCMLTDGVLVVSTIMGSTFLQQRFNYTPEEAGILYTMPYISSAVLSPLVGFYVNKYGNRMTVTIMGSVFMLLAHVLKACIPDCQKCWYSTIPLMLEGFSYTTYAVVLWGALPYLVEARVLGTAFGIVTSAQNLILIIFPPIVGYLN